MTQEERELLLKDICARLPYRVKCEINDRVEILDSICDDDGYHFNFIGNNKEGYTLDEVKPYLFPLMSMSEEQIFEVNDILGEDFEIDKYGITDLIRNRRTSLSYLELDALFKFFDKNHFDYRGLIPMGAAIDATGLNIY